MFLIRVLALFAVVVLSACDPEGREDCAWVLEAEPTRKESVESGYVPMCARNRSTKKQDCRLQTDLEFAKSSYQRKFRYVDLEVRTPALPRTIWKLKFCDGKSPLRLEAELPATTETTP